MADVIGQMNQRIILRTVTLTRDATGGTTKTTTGVSLWAAVKFKEVGSDERQLAEQKVAVTSVNFTIRNHAGRSVSPKDEIVYRGNLYQILSVLETPDANREFLTLESVQLGEFETA